MGVILGLLSAASASLLNVFLKELKDFTPNFLSWVRFLSAALSIALMVHIFIGWEFPPLAFWIVVLLAKIPIETVLAWTMTRSVQISDLSIVGPLQASLTSVFLIPVGWLILGELPTAIGMVGVLSIIIGSFFLGKKKDEEWSLGIINILRDRGAQLAIVASILASVAISVTKFSFQYVSNPLIAAFYATAVLAIVLTPIALKQKQEHLRSRAKPLGGLWLTSSAGIAFHNYGLSLMPAVYFVSIKRLSIIFDVFFGKKFFGEEDTGSRLVGAFIMVAGVVLIAFG